MFYDEDFDFGDFLGDEFLFNDEEVSVNDQPAPRKHRTSKCPFSR